MAFKTFHRQKLGIIKQKLSDCLTVKQLESHIRKEWDNISPPKLVSSLPSCSQNTVKRRGDASQWLSWPRHLLTFHNLGNWGCVFPYSLSFFHTNVVLKLQLSWRFSFSVTRSRAGTASRQKQYMNVMLQSLLSHSKHQKLRDKSAHILGIPLNHFLLSVLTYLACLASSKSVAGFSTA